MGLGPRTPVAPPFARPPVVGLLPTVRALTGETERWEAGFAFNPEQCGESGRANPCGSTAREIADNPPVIEVEPFYVWAGDRCSPFDQTRDRQARALRQLAASESFQLAEELWQGTLAQSETDPNGHPWPNAYLTSEASDVLSASPMSALDALACLEQGLGSCARGARGAIHAPRQVVTAWDNGGMLRREGALILTIVDTLVIADAGYDGSGPYGPATDGHIWAYATGLPIVRLGPVDQQPKTERESIDIALNTIEYWAQREAAVTWDGCCHLAVEMNLPLCGIGGAGS